MLGEAVVDVGCHLAPRHRRPAPGHRASDRLVGTHSCMSAQLLSHKRDTASTRALHRAAFTKPLVRLRMQ